MNTSAGKGSGSRALAAWDRFWFTPADPTPLALIRICCGLVVFYTLLAYTLDLDELIGEHAWLDLETRQLMYRKTPVAAPPLTWPKPVELDPLLAEGQGTPNEKDDKSGRNTAGFPTEIDKGKVIWSVWFHVTDPGAILTIHIAFVVISFLFLVGFCTRLTAALTWFAVLCYTHRAAATLFGADTMMVILLLYLMIGPSGAALSVDRLLARRWAGARPGGLPPSEPSVSANIAVRLLQIHVCIIYLAAGLAKLQGPAWWNGTAVWGTLANFEFAPMQHGWYVGALRLLTENRAVFEVLVTGASLFTLAFEIGYAFLVWRPATRWVFLWGAIILHGMIGMFMGLKTFSLLMLTMNLAFVPPEIVHRWLRRLPGGKDREDDEAPVPPGRSASDGRAKEPVTTSPERQRRGA